MASDLSQLGPSSEDPWMVISPVKLHLVIKSTCLIMLAGKILSKSPSEHVCADHKLNFNRSPFMNPSLQIKENNDAPFP